MTWTPASLASAPANLRGTLFKRRLFKWNSRARLKHRLPHSKYCSFGHARRVSEVMETVRKVSERYEGSVMSLSSQLAFHAIGGS